MVVVRRAPSDPARATPYRGSSTNTPRASPKRRRVHTCT